MQQIFDSWEENADEWIRVMENSSISSRSITNPAIVEAIENTGCHKILDVGCGEGWLCRELSLKGMDVTGIDANIRLLEHASSKGLATYVRMSYEEILDNCPLPNAPYECIVFNFSLYLEKETLLLLDRLKNEITPNGTLLLQTIHPIYLYQNQLPYHVQWIADSWKGLEGGFKNGHPFFLRTFSGWAIPSIMLVFGLLIYKNP